MAQYDNPAIKVAPPQIPDCDDIPSPKPIWFESMALSPAQENNWSATQRETFAVVWALLRTRWLVHNTFPITVVTDHSAIVGIQSKAEPPRAVHTMLQHIMDMNVVVQYTPGATNGAADALSRMSDPLPNKALYNLSKLSPLTEAWAEELQTAFENPPKATEVFNRWQKYIFLNADQVETPDSGSGPSDADNESIHPGENIQWKARKQLHQDALQNAAAKRSIYETETTTRHQNNTRGKCSPLSTIVAALCAEADKGSWREAQLRDAIIHHDITVLENNLGLKLKSVSPTLVKDLTLDHQGVLLCNNKIVIPEGDTHRVLLQAHIQRAMTHRTHGQTREQLEFAYIPNIDAMITQLLRNCDVCKWHMKRPLTQPSAGTTIPLTCFQELEIDFVDVPADYHASGFKYALLARCTLSRFLMGGLVRSKDFMDWAPVFRAQLLGWIAPFVRSIRSDRDTAFRTKEAINLATEFPHKVGWNAVASGEGSETDVTPPSGAHTAQSLVENGVALIRKLIAKISAEFQEKHTRRHNTKGRKTKAHPGSAILQARFHAFLAEVNNTRTDSIGISPFDFVFAQPTYTVVTPPTEHEREQIRREIEWTTKDQEASRELTDQLAKDALRVLEDETGERQFDYRDERDTNFINQDDPLPLDQALALFARRQLIASRFREGATLQDKEERTKRWNALPKYRLPNALEQIMQDQSTDTVHVFVSKERPKVGHKTDPTVTGPHEVISVRRGARRASPLYHDYAESNDKSAAIVTVRLKSGATMEVRSDRCVVTTPIPGRLSQTLPGPGTRPSEAEVEQAHRCTVPSEAETNQPRELGLIAENTEPTNSTLLHKTEGEQAHRCTILSETETSPRQEPRPTTTNDGPTNRSTNRIDKPPKKQRKSRPMKKALKVTHPRHKSTTTGPTQRGKSSEESEEIEICKPITRNPAKRLRGGEP